MSTNTTVYVGFWTNYSRGAITGSTLTLSNRNGAVLIAALAIFIQLAGGRSWTIICFILHQTRASKDAKTGLYHQQQATLRNNNSDVSAIWEFAKIGWAWRRSSIRSYRKTAALITAGILHLLAFAATGILSSHITSVGNEVLLAKSPYCGSWQPPEASGLMTKSNLDWDVGYYSYHNLAAEASDQYVKNCLSQSQSLPECNMYAQTRLNWTASNNPCPFDNLCLGTSNTPLYMDTGLVDSRQDLGINAKDQDRVQLRRNATCSPITTEGYTKSGNSSYSISAEQSIEAVSVSGDVYLPFNYTAAFYGPPTFNESNFGLLDPTLQNATYIYSNFRDIAGEPYNGQVSAYEIHAYSSDIDSGFHAIEPLRRRNGSLTLVFASFFGIYTNPSEDLWLAAHRKIPTVQDSNGQEGSYIYQYSLDHPVSVLACTEHLQFCRSSGSDSANSCSASLSIDAMVNWAENGGLETLFITKKQIRTAKAIMNAAIYTDISTSIKQLKSPLLAGALAYDQISLPPANNQWVLEAQNWFSISLAKIQHLLVDYVTGPPAQFVQFVPLNQDKNDSTLAWLCSNQIIRRSDYTNFSTLGIALIFGIGTIVILSAFWVETVTGFVHIWTGSGEWRQAAWWSEGTLQLQMKAFLGMGINDWKFAAVDRVPVTRTTKEWRSLQNWDEMSNTRKEKRANFTTTDLEKEGAEISILPLSSSNFNDSRIARRTRSYSF